MIIFAILIIPFVLYVFADFTNKSDYCIEDDDCKAKDTVYIDANKK